MNLSAESGNFLFPYKLRLWLWRQSFPVGRWSLLAFPSPFLAFRFGDENVRTTTINFSSSQNCILQTERERAEGEREHKNSHFIHFRPTSNAFLLSGPAIFGHQPIPLHSGFRIPYSVVHIPYSVVRIPHFVFINQLSNLTTTNERLEPGKNLACPGNAGGTLH